MKRRILFISGLWCACAALAVAHHSFDAEFDGKKTVTLHGTVTKFDLINPHGWIYLEGKDETGKTGTWAAETANVSSLLRRGWRKDSLKPGVEVIIEGQPAKDGSNTINARSVKLPDGRKLFSGSTPDGAPVK
jgi:hypothetical protein